MTRRRYRPWLAALHEFLLGHDWEHVCVGLSCWKVCRGCGGARRIV